METTTETTTTQQHVPVPVSLKHYKHTSTAQTKARMRNEAKKRMFSLPRTPQIKSSHDSTNQVHAGTEKKKVNI